MNSIHYDKLVRDKIPEVIQQAGKQPITDILSQVDIAAALDRKLMEEVQEYLESGSVEEMADVLEVLHGTRAWIIPGTEDLMPYIYGKTLIGKWVGTLVGYPMLAAVLAGIMQIVMR